MSESIIAEISRLREMTVGQLRVCWQELYGEETRSRNRDYLWRRLAWRVQELAFGGLPDAAKARMLDITPATSFRLRTSPTFGSKQSAAPPSSGTSVARRDPRLPAPGSTLVRHYRGIDVRVAVLDDGFEWDGRRFDSLSEVAQAVTGSHWSGPLFFGLRQRKRGR